MDESVLTRKAIEELMKEMSDYKEKESLPTERKVNPLGKPNKRFLGRTINSMLTHNKRQNDRNYQKCQRKLKELDDKQRKRDYYERYRNHRKETRRRSKSADSYEVISSSSDEVSKHKKSKKLKRKKMKKKEKSSSSSSSSNTSSSSSSNDSDSSDNKMSSSRSKRKKHKHKNHVKEEETCQEDYYPVVENDPGFSYYVDPNIAYAAMAYNQMHRMLHQQQLEEQQLVKDELEESAEILSDLTLSCVGSDSCLNISLHSSSAEEDENGILTFQLSSDDEKTKNVRKNTSTKDVNSNPSLEDDTESVVSHISLESDQSQKPKSTKNCEVFVLNISSSDSELEIVETEENISKTTENIDKIIQKSVEEENTDKEAKEVKTDEIKNLSDCVDKIIGKSEDLNETSNDQYTVVEDRKCGSPTKSTSMVDLTDD